MNNKSPHFILIFISILVLNSCVNIPAESHTPTSMPGMTLPEATTQYPIQQSEQTQLPNTTLTLIAPTPVTTLSIPTMTYADSQLPDGFYIPDISIEDQEFLRSSPPPKLH